jgi:hypothetical protein
MATAPTMAPAFQTVVERMLAEVPIAKPLDDVAQFNADLAKIMA